jgi:C_GCAxxG_C_C family probable redox protein
MLQDLIKAGYGIDEDLNCAETILYGANIAYQLGFDPEDLKVAAGFGGGMAIESVCGALTAGIMVLGRLCVKEKAHESSRIKELTQELFDAYTKEMGSIYCAPLKAAHRTEEMKCRMVVLTAARILDQMVERENEAASVNE